ncbi:MAG: class I SAM-dependent methyltransferase [Candidatus Accumulibacter sp.]|uniref:class I SAM-dependent methyltransferase n=1 Tax=Accumulibacter sp. TaxID=2053492 RepID=UPI0019EB2CB1|nr:class I SAM-dependent methyltransferase [Accumulibacter sp.]MBE2258379.1 class I SAM-dependent methyltransferase [Paracoccaceae bacterium]MCP5248709.1 class I SAM-dependent methyltransferase [Accumulibacter sp.]
MKNELHCLSEFTYQKESGVHTAARDGSGGEEFAYSDGDEAEEYVFKCIREAGDVSDNSPELVRWARDWSSYYHLAAGRANHIRVLDLPRELSVLELGSGCGAVSRYLGEHHHEVHCVEGSPRRAMITRERCRGLKNVKVFCADFRKLELTPEYDIVLLNGVLEYAPVFFAAEGRSPAEATAALLALARSALRENGILLIAIENKIGLKYWCGATEDHTGRLFDGIHGYPTPGTARTYSRRELGDVLDASGFAFHQFYSCFPDYKFPTTVLADDHAAHPDLFIHNWIEYPAENPGIARDYLIHEGLAARSLSDAGLIHEFANSFLVVASEKQPVGLDRSIKPDWLASKISVANRDRSVHCVTRFFPKTATIEKTLVDYAQGGAKDAKTLAHAVETAKWISGNLLSWEVADAVMSRDFRKALLPLVAEYHDALLQRFATGASDDQGYPLLRGECFDFIMGNIIRTATGLEGIDNEWKMERPLPADYILYRSLSYDVLGRNRRWLGQNVPDADKFVIAVVRSWYPGYDQQRHDRNRSLESAILSEVRGELGGTKWISSEDGMVPWKRAIKKIARKTPAGLKARIVRLSAAVDEKLRVLFAES